MKKLFILTLLNFTSFNTPIIANETSIIFENNGYVQGIVIDSKLNEPLHYATVIIENKVGQTLTGGITDGEGYIKVNNLADGIYNVKIQYIDFEPYTREITISTTNNPVNLGTFALKEDIESLKEVVVVTEVSTMEQRVDRRVINEGSDLITAGPTSSDIFNNLPPVSVDEQSISLR